MSLPWSRHGWFAVKSPFRPQLHEQCGGAHDVDEEGSNNPALHGLICLCFARASSSERQCYSRAILSQRFASDGQEQTGSGSEFSWRSRSYAPRAGIRPTVRGTSSLSLR